MRSVFLYLVVAFCQLWSTAQAVDGAEEAKENKGISTSYLFERDILPILQQKCCTCHGEKVQKAELNLSSQSGVARGSSSGPVIVAGKPEESLLFEVVHDGLMPPSNSTEPLTPEETGRLQEWIAGGARFSQPDVVAEPAITEREVSQIMLLRCAVCHNGRVKEGGLDLRSRQSMLSGGKSGPAINLKRPSESLMLKKIHAGEMPPLRRLASASVKVIETAEVETVAKWIAAGAPLAAHRTERDPAEIESEVTDEDKQFWSFKSPVAHDVPRFESEHRIRNPIDAFVLEKLKGVGLTLSPDADRRTLIRRATFDLIGLPPTPEDVESFIKDPDPAAYEKLIDRLLESRHYGERWGRYWLDLAGYSDSDGVNAEDPIRHFAYRYRDYVIRSFNNDKPYDRFLLEQIAGDELVDYENAPDVTDEIYDNLVATGFLRMAPDGTYNGLTNFVPDRLDVIASEIDVLTSSVMGLTVKCARCHSHKFDPIPHRDYYSLAAILKGALDENDWLRPSKANQDFPLRGLTYVPSEEKAAWEAEQKRLKGMIEAIQTPLEARQRELVTAQLEKHLPQLPEILHEDLRAAALAPRDKRNEVQKYLVTKFEKLLKIDMDSLEELDPAFKELARDSFKQIKRLKSELNPNEPFIHALWDRGQPTPTYILRRGNYLSPGKAVDPGVPTVLADAVAPYSVIPPWEDSRKTGRRLAFARWLVDPRHPLTARVMTNRIWKHHFQHGIVKSLDNFGRAGQVPTHPELLDWLSIQFVERGWSIKAIHRLIMTSSTYRQSSEITEEHANRDLDNRLLSRYPLRRLEAEVLRDSLLFVSGKLDPTQFGPAERVERRDDGLVTSVGSEKGWRRSIYVLQRRSQSSTILEDFDLPQMAPNCVERTVATVAPQALHLLNNKMVHDWSRAMAERIIQDVGTDRTSQIQRAFALAVGRQPDAAELELVTQSFDELSAKWHATLPEPPASPAGNSVSLEQAAHEATAELGVQTLTNLCHALMNSAEFMYVD
ncbi:PSD1 and planctomycete cytochrome C domain-containing protein [Schlesneria sp.]|uniref:PSD1 and planctomycete cytochrome C domain-containing protein n=1 Tax=Schlesneria sp. TaxID=2762018 RepID=UPI002EFF0D31